MFRGHVGGGAGAAAFSGEFLGQAGQTEVGDLDGAGPVDHDVGGLEVAMEDALGVGGGDAGAELPGDLDGAFLGEASDAAEE